MAMNIKKNFCTQAQMSPKFMIVYVRELNEGILDEWRSSILVPLFRKGDKVDPNNYLLVEDLIVEQVMQIQYLGTRKQQ